MPKSTLNAIIKSRGRPATGKGTPIVTRLHPDILKTLDEFIAKSDTPDMSRPEAIRRILAERLRG